MAGAAHFVAGTFVAFFLKLTTSIDDLLWFSPFLALNTSLPDRARCCAIYATVCLLVTIVAVVVAHAARGGFDALLSALGRDDDGEDEDGGYWDAGRMLSVVASLFVGGCGVKEYLEWRSEDGNELPSVRDVRRAAVGCVVVGCGFVAGCCRAVLSCRCCGPCWGSSSSAAGRRSDAAHQLRIEMMKRRTAALDGGWDDGGFGADVDDDCYRDLEPTVSCSGSTAETSSDDDGEESSPPQTAQSAAPPGRSKRGFRNGRTVRGDLELGSSSAGVEARQPLTEMVGRQHKLTYQLAASSSLMTADDEAYQEGAAKSQPLHGPSRPAVPCAANATDGRERAKRPPSSPQIARAVANDDGTDIKESGIPEMHEQRQTKIGSEGHGSQHMAEVEGNEYRTIDIEEEGADEEDGDDEEEIRETIERASQSSSQLFAVAFCGTLDDMTMFAAVIVGKSVHWASLVAGSMLATVVILFACWHIALYKPFADFIQRVPLWVLLTLLSLYILIGGLLR